MNFITKEPINKGWSSDKNQDEYIDICVCKTKVFPDNAEHITNCLKIAGLSLIEQY